MTRFLTGTVYIIENARQLRKELINWSKFGFNVTTDSIRKSLDGSLVIIKVKLPIPEALQSYELYNQDEILNVVSGPTWEANPE